MSPERRNAQGQALARQGGSRYPPFGAGQARADDRLRSIRSSGPAIGNSQVSCLIKRTLSRQPEICIGRIPGSGIIRPWFPARHVMPLRRSGLPCAVRAAGSWSTSTRSTGSTWRRQRPVTPTESATPPRWRRPAPPGPRCSRSRCALQRDAARRLAQRTFAASWSGVSPGNYRECPVRGPM
jgi:hypothetical protein